MKLVMRLLTLSLFFAFIVDMPVSKAQSLRVKAGADLLNIQGSSVSLFEESYSSQIGYRLGLVNEFEVTKRLGLQYGLMAANKKIEANTLRLGVDRTETLDAYYLDIPIALKYYITSGNSRLFTTLGFTMGVGLFGNKEVVTEADNVTTTEESDIAWGSASDSDLGRFEYGIGLGVGVQIQSLEISLAYSHGINDFAPINGDGREFKRAILHLGVAYTLPKKMAEEPTE